MQCSYGYINHLTRLCDILLINFPLPLYLSCFSAGLTFCKEREREAGFLAALEMTGSPHGVPMVLSDMLKYWYQFV